MNRLMPKVETSGPVTVLTFTGKTVGAFVSRISSELEGHVAAAGERHLLLDFTNVDRITSEDLGTLVRLHKAVAAAGGQLTLFNLCADVYEVFTVTRLHTLLGICRVGHPLPAE
jgi:anti-anti-sigma factor